jgi:hypothetical protein
MNENEIVKHAFATLSKIRYVEWEDFRDGWDASVTSNKELFGLLEEMVRLHDERGCVLTVHMERLKELLAETTAQ